MPAKFYSLFDNLFTFLKKDISLSLSVGYVVLISLGILYNYLYYRAFEIDILSYCDLTDLLITPIRQPLLLAFFVGNLCFFYLIALFDGWFLDKFPALYKAMSLGVNTESKGYMLYKHGTGLLALLFYIYVSTNFIAQRERRKLRNQHASKAHIVLKTANEGLTAVDKVVIGKVSNFLIVKADTSRKKAIIYPMENVHSIEMRPDTVL